MRREFQLVCFGALALCTLFFACDESSASDLAAPSSITLKVSERYAVTDMDDLDATFFYTGTSSDENVAVLQSGKYIFAVGEGTASVTVSGGDTARTYNVTVLPDDTLMPVEPSDRDANPPLNTCYIGYGYDAFSGEEFNQFIIDSEASKQLFDWNKVWASGKLLMSSSQSSQKTIYGGKSVSDYQKSVSEKKTVTVAVKFLWWKVYEKTWSQQTTDTVEKKSISGINKLYLYTQYASYILFPPSDGYDQYLKDDVRKALRDENISPATFVSKYGTHVAVGTEFGHSFELNYIISPSARSYKTKEFDTKKELDVIAYNERFFNRKLKCSTAEAESFQKNFAGLSRESDGSVVVIGGTSGAVRKGNVDDELAVKAYSCFFSPVVAEEESSQLIGPRNATDLIPLWELLPASMQDRKRAFVSYVNERMEKEK